MVNVNISIKKEAYDFLKMRKNRNKSFSDVILEFKEKTKDPMVFFGILKDLDWKKKEISMKELRDSFNRRIG